jgi:phytol kinase
VPARRTWEGSGAVLFAGTGAAWAGLLALGTPSFTALAVAGAVGVVSAVVEAVSHHGTDNLTVQLAASLVALALLR